jgi:hypothetical protein
MNVINLSNPINGDDSLPNHKNYVKLYFRFFIFHTTYAYKEN